MIYIVAYHDFQASNVKLGEKFYVKTLQNMLNIYKSLHLSNGFSLLHQVFVGKIPRDLYEDELVPLFESAGAIWDLRLMMDPLSGQNRGYAFITYCNKDDAQKAVKLVSRLSRHWKKHIKPFESCLF